MFLLAGKSGDARLAVALNFVTTKALDQDLAHLTAEFLTGRDHRLQIPDLLARVWVFYNRGYSHLA